MDSNHKGPVYAKRFHAMTYSSYMMTSSNGNISRVTGHLCGEFTGPGEFPALRPVTRSFDVFFDLRLNNGWENNPEAGDFKRHRGHYDVIVMASVSVWLTWNKLPIICIIQQAFYYRKLFEVFPLLKENGRCYMRL